MPYDDPILRELGGYFKAEEPGRRERADAWATAIGLQKVDGLTTSQFLFNTAKDHIEGASRRTRRGGGFAIATQRRGKIQKRCDSDVLLRHGARAVYPDEEEGYKKDVTALFCCGIIMQKGGRALR